MGCIGIAGFCQTVPGGGVAPPAQGPTAPLETIGCGAGAGVVTGGAEACNDAVACSGVLVVGEVN